MHEYLWAKQRNKTSPAKAFLYLWDHTLPGPNAERLGAFHTAEVPYVLNTLDISDRPFTDADRKAAAMASSYWANFAKTGDPNGPGLPVWPAIGDKPEITQVGDKNAPVPAASTAAQSAFWERFLICAPLAQAQPFTWAVIRRIVGRLEMYEIGQFF
jgi:carboxylesterase type B